MGEVFLGHDDRLDRPVAIKRIQPGQVSAISRRRFQREAWAVARLSHPAIVAIFDVSSDEESDWIVMELVDGPTLREALNRQGRPHLEQALSWALQIAEGLSAAHTKGILHRDLKPENVMISGSGHAKIVDFGLARAVTAESGLAELTTSGAVLGTLSAMAPEQARGHRIDHRADLFSLGLLLYELFTGHRAFEGDSPLDLLTRLASAPHAPLTAHDPQLPLALACLVDDLLAKSPEARPVSAAVVATTLRALSRELPEPEARAVAMVEPVRGAETIMPGERSSVVSGSSALSRARLLSGRLWLIPCLVLLGLGISWGLARFATAPLAAERASDPLALVRAGNAELERWEHAGEVESAIDDFLRALQLAPDSAPAYAGLARAYWRKSRGLGRDPQYLRQALATAERAVQLDEYLAAAHLSLGFAAVDLGRLEQAATAFDRVERLDPGNPDLALGRGHLALARNDLAAAESAYRAALGRDERSEFQNALGSLFYRQKRYQEAEAAFRRAIALAPDTLPGHRNLAAALQAQGDSSQAAAELQRAIEIAPNSTLYTSLGTIFYFQGLYIEAHEAFEKAITAAAGEKDGHGTNNPILWGNLGDSCRRLPGQEEEGRLAFKRAAQLARQAATEKDDVELRSRLALYLARGGESEAARAELTALLARSDLDLSARSRALLAYEALGDRATALAVFAEASKLGLPLAEIEREPELEAFRADPAYHRQVAAIRAQ